MTEKLMTVKEIAEMFGVNVFWVYKAYKEGRLRGYKIGTHTLRFKKSEVEKFINSTGKAMKGNKAFECFINDIAHKSDADMKVTKLLAAFKREDEGNDCFTRNALKRAISDVLEISILTLEQEVYSAIAEDFDVYTAICNAVMMRKSELDDSDEMGGCR